MVDPTSDYRDSRDQNAIGICEEEGCGKPGLPCWLPDLDGTKVYDAPDAYYCQAHIEATGFCSGCGHFWGGVESFDFDPQHLCDNCRHDPDLSDGYERNDDHEDWFMLDDAPAWLP